MPSMILLDPTMRQAPVHEEKFDEKLVLQKARQDVDGLVQKCKDSLNHPYQPNSIISVVGIPNGQFIDETIQAYRKVAKEKNKELRQEGADIHLDVRESHGSFYFVAGLYGKPEAETQLRGSFVLDLHAVSEADYLALASSMDIEDKEHFLTVVKDAYHLAREGKIDLSHVVIERMDNGYQIRQDEKPEGEGIPLSPGQTSRSASNPQEKQKTSLAPIPTSLEFTLSAENYEMLDNRLEEQTGKRISEWLKEDRKKMLEAILDLFSTEGKKVGSAVSVGGSISFDVNNLKEGDTLSYVRPNGLNKDVKLKKIEQSGQNQAVFVGEDGKRYVLKQSEDRTATELQLANLIAPDDSASGLRLPNQTCSSRLGDCDEVSILAASFLKQTGYQGELSIAPFVHSGYTAAHAFLLVRGEKGGEPDYRVDFTISPTVAEMKPVYENGAYSLGGTIETSYKQDSRKIFPVDYAHEVKGWNAIQSYGYAQVGWEYLREYAGSIDQQNATDEGFNSLKEYSNFLTSGLDIDKNNQDLLMQRGAIWVVWKDAFKIKYQNEVFTRMGAESKEDLTAALALDSNNDKANYWMGRYLWRVGRLEEASDFAKIANSLNTNSKSYQRLLNDIQQDIAKSK